MLTWDRLSSENPGVARQAAGDGADPTLRLAVPDLLGGCLEHGDSQLRKTEVSEHAAADADLQVVVATDVDVIEPDDGGGL